MEADDAASQGGDRAKARPNSGGGTPVLTPAYPRRGLGSQELRVTGGFWRHRQEVNASVSMGHCLYWLERSGWLANFDAVAAGSSRPHQGWPFADSEVYKLLEALAWEYGRTGDPSVDRGFRTVSARVLAAQDADGYLDTAFGHPGRPPRYSDLSAGHELYCIGHFLQAAVARMRTVGEDAFVTAARRAADHVCREFGSMGRQAICGHPEIELGLVEFGRAVGEPAYVEQARTFIRRRGHRTLTPPPLLSSEYFQDDRPVMEREAWSGHAVRALYLAAAAVDTAVEAGSTDEVARLAGQWHRTVSRRSYVTGGMGSRHQDEGFGEDFELPADRAYCETCAGVASIMVSWRLYLATGAVEYADQIERTLFNVVAGAVNDAGNRFFYANTLYQRTDARPGEEGEVAARAETSFRAPWFDVSCCPGNLARTMASLGSYMASLEDGVLTILQYADLDVDAQLANGRLALALRTDYPDSGRVEVSVRQAPPDATVRLRVPAWATGARLVGPRGERSVAPGWVDVPVESGDRIELIIPVAARVRWPDPRIDAVRGCVCVERGPLVLCLEACDLPEGTGLDDIEVDAGSVGTCPGGATIDGWRRSIPHGVEWCDHPPDQRRSPVGPLRLVPYLSRAERSTSAMRVFLPCHHTSSGAS